MKRASVVCVFVLAVLLAVGCASQASNSAGNSAVTNSSLVSDKLPAIDASSLASSKGEGTATAGARGLGEAIGTLLASTVQGDAASATKIDNMGNVGAVRPDVIGAVRPEVIDVAKPLIKPQDNPFNRPQVITPPILEILGEGKLAKKAEN